jgi:uncharacterized protein YoxC
MASSQVDVQPEALSELKNALLVFRSSASEQLNSIQHYLKRVSEVLAQAEQQAQAEVRECEEMLQRLQQHSRDARYSGDGMQQQKAAQRLRQAQEHLRKVQHHKREVEQAIQSYTQQAQRLGQQLVHEIPRAAASLDRKVGLLNQYQVTFLTQMSWGLRKHGNKVLEFTAALIAFSSWLAQQSPVAEVPQVEARPQGGYAQEQRASCNARHTHATSSPTEIPGEVEQLADSNEIEKQRRKEQDEAGYTEEPTTSAGTNPHGHWFDRGIQNVRLAELPNPEGIHSSDDFKKVSQAVMQAGIQRLQEMLPIIERGEGQNTDYWAQVDQRQGLTYEHGYQRIYEAFYGDSAIKLERIGNQYTITNGRHRLWLAKQMGIEMLPAQVTERQAT